ncbi:zinc transporter ZIP1-like [Panulirus ornatus]|uniref:zinc transporter ZIP1-like n=1 Tax=Panulirus ornatus TaxID=150431 RepID=UPI003A89BA2D
MLSVEETKALALVLMASMTLAVSFLPLYIRRFLLHKLHKASGQLLLSGCLCFGAGVLLSIVFLHMLPETRSNISYLMDVGYMKTTSYPVAEVMVCCGFFLVYLIEEIIHSYVDGHQEGEDVEVSITGPTTYEEAKRRAKQERTSVDRFSSTRLSETPSSTVVSVATLVGTRGWTNECFEGSSYFGDCLENVSPRHNVHATPHCHHSSPLNKATTLMSAVVVVVALSFHSIMEGLALGLEDESTDVWILFGALCAHKICLSFSMSMELLEVGLSFKSFLASMIIFSLASPIGGLIGSIVVGVSGEDSPEGVLVPTILQAVSGGTILYVTFCEVLERERAKAANSRVQFMTFMLGFSVMAGLEGIGGHEHGYNSSNHANTTLAGYHPSPPFRIP